MECPECHDANEQMIAGYRCAKCGRVYGAPKANLGKLLGQLDELKAHADAMTRQQTAFARRIAKLEAQIKAALGG